MTPADVITAVLAKTRDQTAGQLTDRIITALTRRGYVITRKEDS